MPGVHERVRCTVKGCSEADAPPARRSAAAAAACASGASGQGTAAKAAVRLLACEVPCAAKLSFSHTATSVDDGAATHVRQA